MFARNETMHLKTNCLKEYSKTVEGQIIPMLRNQDGFQDEISFVEPGGTEAIGITLWKTKEDAENYGRTTYKKVLTSLADIIVGTPEVHTYEVTNSTPHRAHVRLKPQNSLLQHLGGDPVHPSGAASE